MDLYYLLPTVVREKDLGTALAAGETETILQKVFYALETEAEVTKDQIEGIIDLFSVDNCPEEYLPLLNGVLGSSFPGSWSEDRVRMFLKGVVLMYHRSGQRITWEAMLRLLGYAGYFPWELWKEAIYEEFDYSLYGDYFLLRAARVDLRKADETYLAPTDEIRTMLEQFRPIHVLIRTFGEAITYDDVEVPPISESFAGLAAGGWIDGLAPASDSCISSCETYCETSCEASSCEGTIEIVLTCISGCQTGCETTGDI